MAYYSPKPQVLRSQVLYVSLVMQGPIQLNVSVGLWLFPNCWWKSTTDTKLARLFRDIQKGQSDQASSSLSSERVNRSQHVCYMTMKAESWPGAWKRRTPALWPVRPDANGSNYF